MFWKVKLMKSIFRSEEHTSELSHVSISYAVFCWLSIATFFPYTTLFRSIVEWGLFNSKFWGVPQNRERVFILVTRKDVFKAPKLFDLLKKQTEVNTKLIDVLESEVDEKYF